ncbi:flavin reductase family protein [Chengkuizengella axinellae]|uniref:Flavin reductase family protein n=1 Tax=Chengkuizengella axinellae TaxID=3064388 RepID=A0ABT9ITV4_9BACL|nr:flavin reductase family protein [Chengkuizengella sp. 2205SS18-9]MDP5272781.1 flavin reductase family protein [Chengkuizengella sp. 2205SS18-9]
MHKTIEPKILYFGTPVVLISTLNENGTANLAPMSSAWWLGQSCMLGMSRFSQTVQNLERERECVLNIPSADLVSIVDKLALLTGKNPVPKYKEKMGYRYEPNKFEIADLNGTPSELVKAPRVTECPVQLEAIVENINSLQDPKSSLAAIEVSIKRVHVDENILIDGEKNYIDPEKWNPLIMSFCEFFGLSGKLHPSKLVPAFGLPHNKENLRDKTELETMK